tara:strand:+ start:231 stop:569 length:339 start_codon:yes stop_codon:yes gene_type:complete
MDITNFNKDNLGNNNFDNFDNNDFITHNKVHLRMQQRNGKKCITIIQGLESDLDLKKILKYFKKTFQCNGSITDDKEYGEIIQLSGNQKENVRKFLIDEEIISDDQIVIHGY